MAIREAWRPYGKKIRNQFFECLGCHNLFLPENMHKRSTAQVRGGMVQWLGKWVGKIYNVNVHMIDQLCKSCYKKDCYNRDHGLPRVIKRRPVTRGL